MQIRIYMAVLRIDRGPGVETDQSELIHLLDWAISSQLKVSVGIAAVYHHVYSCIIIYIVYHITMLIYICHVLSPPWS